MRPARVGLVPGGVSTRMRSKPLRCRRKSVTAMACPPPMREATIERSPNQRRACARLAATSSSGSSTIASLIAATVRPGISRSQPRSTASADSSSGSAAPGRARAGSGCTIE